MNESMMTSRTFCAAVLATGALVAGVSAQDARPTPQFRFERPIVAASGRQRLRIDVPILAQTRRELTDLRIFDAAGREVPYLLIPPARPSLEWAPGRVSLIAATQKTSGFEIDLGNLITIDRIRLSGIPAPFMKRANVEGSGDRARWTVLRNQTTVFDLPDYQLQQLEVAFTPGSYRYVRVTWDDRNSAKVPRPAVISARKAVLETAPAAPLTAPIEFERRPSEPGKSRYHLRLPGPHLPVEALDLTIGGGYVLRRAVITESRLSNGRMAPVIIGATILRRIVQGDLSATALRIPIAKPDEPELDLTIDDGDNPALDLKGVTAVFDELPWIYFESDGGDLVARYGDARLGPPRYDLEAARESIQIEKVADASWGAPRAREPVDSASGMAPMPTGGAPIDAKLFRYLRAIPAGEAGLIALPLDAAALTHSSGPRAYFADLRVIDAGERQVPYVLERRDEPLELPITIEQRQAPPAGAQQSGAISYYRVRLPFPNLPSAQLVLTTSARVFERIAAVSIERPADTRHRDAWLSQIATGRWAHAEQSRPAPALTLSLSPVDATELLLVISEGDNSRLPITATRLLLPSYRVRLFRDDRATLRMVYGRSDLGPPSYDLAILAPQVLGVSAREVSPAAEEAGAAARQGLAASALMSPRVFWGVLVVAVIALAVLLMRLLKQEPMA
jgi:hypothetical protein